MGNTVHVRYPDAEKDKPDTPGVPNKVKTISAHKLGDYRDRGFVQCAADGSKLDKTASAQEAAASEPVAMAGAGDDEHATVAKERAKEAAARAKGPTPPAPAGTKGGDA